MTVAEIRNIITQRGIEITFKGKRKRDLIHTIQQNENNFDCYATQNSESCGQDLCLWRTDCIKEDKLIN